MPPAENILVVSDLHFGEELLPGASAERRRAIELGETAFREFLAYHAVRRRDGRPWRLVVAGDLFDFMSVIIDALPDRPARTRDERTYGLPRGVATGVARIRRICEAHRGLLAALGRFVAAGHSIDIIAGNHDVELIAPEVATEFMEQLARAGVDANERARIRIVPWFVYVPGVCWIEHGHVYDEGCSFEFNLSPMDPQTGWLVHNIDYAAIRYFANAAPDLDPHGIESWSFWGYMRYAMGHGFAHMGRMWMGYGRFIASLWSARRLHRSFARRERRRREHRTRLVAAAHDGGLEVETAAAIDRLARTPCTVSVRRLGRVLMLDRMGLVLGVLVALIALFVALPLPWAFVGAGMSVGAAAGITRWLGSHLVTSQLPMRSVPQRLRKLVDAPAVIFGHTHDPRWQRLRSGGVYVNCGTWLPATKPGLRRSFTHVLISPAHAVGAPPVVELRQWRDGLPQAFDAQADLGAGVTVPGIPLDQTRPGLAISRPR